MIILFYLITSCLLLPENYFWSQKKSLQPQEKVSNGLYQTLLGLLNSTGLQWAVVGCSGL